MRKSKESFPDQDVQTARKFNHQVKISSMLTHSMKDDKRF